MAVQFKYLNGARLIKKDRERRKKGLPTLKEQHISGMLFAKDKKKTSLF
jgi:hypothetical protein